MTLPSPSILNEVPKGAPLITSGKTSSSSTHRSSPNPAYGQEVTIPLCVSMWSPSSRLRGRPDGSCSGLQPRLEMNQVAVASTLFAPPLIYGGYD